MKFFTVISSWLALVFLFHPIKSWAHGDHDTLPGQVLELVYQSMLEAMSTQNPSLSGEGFCFTVVDNDGSENSQCLTEQGFDKILAGALPIAEKALKQACETCNETVLKEVQHSFKVRVEIIKQKLKTGRIQLTGWALEKVKVYGPSWLIYTLLFEAVEHSILWWLPPGSPICMIGQAAYFCTAGFVKNTYSVAADTFVPDPFLSRVSKAVASNFYEIRARWRLRSLFLGAENLPSRKEYDAMVNGPKAWWYERLWNWFASHLNSGYLKTRWFITGKTVEEVRSEDPMEFDHEIHEVEEYLAKTSFWGSAYLHFRNSDEKVAPATLAKDLDFIFSQAPKADRYFRAFQHTNGFNLMVKILGEILDARFEKEHKSLIEQRGKVHASVQEMNEWRCEYRFKQAKQALGSLGSLIHRYKRLLISAALSGNGELATGNAKKAVTRFLHEVGLLMLTTKDLDAVFANPEAVMFHADALIHIHAKLSRGNYLSLDTAPCALEILLTPPTEIPSEKVASIY